MQKVTKQVLIDAGYREYKNGFHPDCLCLQRTIWDNQSGKKKYFINFRLSSLHIPGMIRRDFVESEVVFYLTEAEDSHINVSLPFNKSVAGTEAVYEKVYVQLGCVPDVLNNH
jgi:hypothetical protein